MNHSTLTIMMRTHPQLRVVLIERMDSGDCSRPQTDRRKFFVCMLRRPRPSHG